MAWWDDVDLLDPVNKDHDLLRGLVSWWLPLPNTYGGGQAWDIFSIKHGTLTNGPTWSPGGGLTFDGSNDHVPLSNLPTTFSQITVLSTARPNDASRRWIIADYPSSGTALSYGLRYQSGWVFNSDTLGQSASTTGTVGTLENVAGTYDGQRFRIYTGGQLRHTSFPTSGDLVRPAGGVPTMGRAGAFDGQYWNGLIGHLAIFNRALSGDEIAQFHDQTLRGYPDLLNRRKRRLGHISASPPPPPPPTSYTLPADSAAYAAAGQPANLLAARRVAADADTLTLAGQPANLLARRTLTAEPASYVVTGQPANLVTTGSLTADPAVFLVAGQTVNLRIARRITAVPTSFAIAGQDAAIFAARRVSGDAAAISLTGQDAELLKGQAGGGEHPWLVAGLGYW